VPALPPSTGAVVSRADEQGRFAMPAFRESPYRRRTRLAREICQGGVQSRRQLSLEKSDAAEIRRAVMAAVGMTARETSSQPRLSCLGSSGENIDEMPNRFQPRRLISCGPWSTAVSSTAGTAVRRTRGLPSTKSTRPPLPQVADRPGPRRTAARAEPACADP